MYVLQWLNGTFWSNRLSGNNEQVMMIQGKQISNSCSSSRRYRLIFKEGSRQSVIHLF